MPNQKQIKFLCTLLLVLTVLAACGGETVEPDASASSQTATTTETEAQAEPQPEKVRLNADFDDALSVQSQLIVGIVQLEATDLALDADTASKILPLWQAVQALAQSETTASAEINAIINQIQGTMQPEQVQAIAAMSLTNAGFQEMVANGEIEVRGPGGGRGGDAAGGAGGAGGGAGGGGRGGGLLAPGGGGQGGGQGLGNLTPEEIAAQRAERGGGGADGGDNPLITRGMANAMMRLLQEKAGIEVERPQGQGGQGGLRGPRGVAVTVIAEQLGITPEEVQTQSAESTLLDVIETNSGDADAILEAVMTALNESDFAANIEDIDAVAAGLLDGTFVGAGRPQPQQGDE